MGCWPTEYQELLLKAALLHGNEAMDAWAGWRNAVDLDNIDHESQMLLPLLYRNLSSLGLKDPNMNRYQGVQRKAWAKNHVVFHEIGILLRKFRDVGIKTMLLKGSAMIILYYKDYGLRPMGDIDILVPVEKAKEVIQILFNQGWRIQKNSGPTFTEEYPALIGENHFENTQGLLLDVHWHLLEECAYAGADDDFWMESVEANIHGDLTVNVLNPTDQFFHVVVHAMRWNSQPLVLWAADAMMILNNEHAIDWKRIISQAKSRRLILPVKNGTTYLHDLLGAPIPDHVLNEIQKIPISLFEYHEFRFKNHSWKLFEGLVGTWFRYRRVGNNKSFAGHLWGYLMFIKYYMEVKHLWQLPFNITTYGLRKIRFAFKYWLKVRVRSDAS